MFWCLACTAVILVWHAGNSAMPCWADTGDASGDPSNSQMVTVSFPKENDPFSGISFPTFNKTGLDACTNTDGRPLIFLFSSSSCFHCDWAKDIFNFIARYYTAQGLIEAYHYDITTGDNLLTETVETKIPPEHLQLKEHGNPKGLVPYFNFGCKYERVGNGHEEAGDIAAEGAEIRQVIDTLVRILSKGDS